MTPKKRERKAKSLEKKGNITLHSKNSYHPCKIEINMNFSSQVSYALSSLQVKDSTIVDPLSPQHNLPPCDDLSQLTEV